MQWSATHFAPLCCLQQSRRCKRNMVKQAQGFKPIQQIVVYEILEIVLQNITFKCSSMEMISPELTGIGQLRWNGFLNLLRQSWNIFVWEVRCLQSTDVKMKSSLHQLQTSKCKSVMGSMYIYKPWFLATTR